MRSDPVIARALEAAHHLDAPVAGWDEILRGACQLLEGDSATLIMLDGNGELLSFQQHDIDAVAERDYVSHYFAEDILVPLAANAPAGCWFDTGRLFSVSDLSRNSFYVDFMCKHRMSQLVTHIVADHPWRRGALTVQRSKSVVLRRTLSKDLEIRQFTQQIREGLQRRETAAQQLLQQFDSVANAFGEAIVLLTSNAAIVHASESALQLLEASHSGLRLRGRRLWHAESSVREAIVRCVAKTASTGNAGSANFHHLNPSLAARLRLDFIKADGRFGIGCEKLVLAKIAFPITPPNELSPSSLSDAFRLTVAEGRVLFALTNGATIKGYAMVNGVSYHTVRCQVAALLHKMGCERQVDLVRKALSLNRNG